MKISVRSCVIVTSLLY